MQLLYGTGNSAKLETMERCLSPLGIGLLSLKDMAGPVPQVDETGRDALENARQKAEAYFHAFDRPVFSCDSGLYLDQVPPDLQPGVHVRSVGGKRLSDGEMTEYYGALAKKYGPLTARYRNAICFIADGQHIYQSMDDSLSGPPFIITSVPHPKRVEGFPLDCLSIHIQSGRYYYDMDGYKADEMWQHNGFFQFFKSVLKL